MIRVTRILAVASLSLALVAMVPDAQAQPKRSSRMGASASSAMRSPARSSSPSRISAPSTRGSNRSSRPGRSSMSPSRNPIGSRPQSNYPGSGAGILGDVLRQGLEARLGDRGYDKRNDWFDYLRDREDARSDAFRDALIADMIVRVVGIIASTSPQQTPILAPAPRVAVPAPGHYETRRVVVREGYWQSEEVWVPEAVDPATGVVVEGHYEIHKRWVPEVYEETQVWVPHQTPLP